jgi:Methyltransferase domain
MESRVATSTASASPLAVFRPGSLTAYWQFQRAVAKAQLAAWLPAGRRVLIDISGPGAACPAQAAGFGHAVVRVHAAHPGVPAAGERGRPPGRVAPVVAEPGSLAFLADGCADGVIAEDGALSRHLMAEDLAAEIARVLRPGGELLACVDSLVLGMAMLAERRQWAHLTDLPHAEVVLIPWPDGTITRCFGAAQLYDLLTEAGLKVTSIRPRTVLSPSTVNHVLRQQPGALARLVRAEMQAGQDPVAGASADEAFGISLVATARKPVPRDQGMP